MSDAEILEACLNGDMGSIAEARAHVEAELSCEHLWKRLPGVTSNNVKLTVCERCGAQHEEDVS